MSIHQNLAQRVSKVRKLRGLSRQKLSDRLDGKPSRITIFQIETCKRINVTVEELIRLASALEVSPLLLAPELKSTFPESVSELASEFMEEL
jgi:transcriptional regulator with XRE-family HTH domain